MNVNVQYFQENNSSEELLALESLLLDSQLLNHQPFQPTIRQQLRQLTNQQPFERQLLDERILLDFPTPKSIRPDNQRRLILSPENLIENQITQMSRLNQMDKLNQVDKLNQ